MVVMMRGAAVMKEDDKKNPGNSPEGSGPTGTLESSINRHRLDAQSLAVHPGIHGYQNFDAAQ